MEYRPPFIFELSCFAVRDWRWLRQKISNTRNTNWHIAMLKVTMSRARRGTTPETTAWSSFTILWHLARMFVSPIFIINLEMHSHFGCTTAAYKAKIHSLFVTLKDKNNPGLRRNVVSGEMPGERLLTLTSEDVTSEGRKAADLKIKVFQFSRSEGATSRNGSVPVFAMRASLCFHHGLRVAHRLSLF